MPRNRYHRYTHLRSRLSDNGTLIYPQKLIFTHKSDQARELPLINNRRAACIGRRDRDTVQRNKYTQIKRPRLPNGEAQIQLTRKGASFSSLEFSKPQSNVPKTAHHLGNLSILPNEVILKIVQKLEDNTLDLHYQRVQDFGLVCLALTSMSFYKICKTCHPAPLPTMRGDGIRDEKKQFWAWSLERHIGDFLGRAYKVRELDSRYGFYT
ncbi:hypothetical protein DL95DRAFT_405154 [Leptodontidium sp. 2 PMI_412]|nr:hypothetical protein BKA61DRAFT_570373 [Leptodontidium sp. MPI-SDFR-AT-0119]KAH9219233.1 hypothetical protein DL95DRAFT_405154 [Leptodontidium sp. 2 PMI_412]